MRKKYKLLINPQAYDDIQKAIDYYNDQQKGLGKRFHSKVKDAFEVIKKNPMFQVRYDNIRCLPVKPFPYMVHYSVDGDMINARAVINTACDPDKSWIK